MRVGGAEGQVQHAQRGVWDMMWVGRQGENRSKMLNGKRMTCQGSDSDSSECVF